MKAVKIIRRGTEESGTWCFELELENGDRIVMDNCSRIPEVYLGNVRERNEEGEEITKAVHLFVYENETGEVTL